MMTKHQFIEIAKSGFPDFVQNFIEFDRLEMHHMSGVFRLYDRDTPFILAIPSKSLLTIHIENKTSFVQITPEKLSAFNHYAAIKKMEKFNLI